MATNNFFGQTLSNILSMKVFKPRNIESTSLGAAYLAGIGSNYINLSELKDVWKIDKLFEPKKSYEKEIFKIFRQYRIFKLKAVFLVKPVEHVVYSLPESKPY